MNPPQTNTKKWIWIAVLVVVVCAVAYGVWQYYEMRSPAGSSNGLTQEQIDNMSAHGNASSTVTTAELKSLSVPKKGTTAPKPLTSDQLSGLTAKSAQ